MLATGVSGNGAQTGLAFARLCMPDVTTPPKKVVVSFRPQGVYVAITHYIDHGEMGRQTLALSTAHFQLKHESLHEILDGIFGSDVYQNTERLDLVIEANQIAQMHAVQLLKEDDQFLQGTLELAEAFGSCTVEPFTPKADQ